MIASVLARDFYMESFAGSALLCQTASQYDWAAIPSALLYWPQFLFQAIDIRTGGALLLRFLQHAASVTQPVRDSIGIGERDSQAYRQPRVSGDAHRFFQRVDG